ncbi:MAG: LacI family DNA-binding transcriptional regulator [Opitutaceae bacterium]|nr:LacI family DNA-binding transcriptional regulator [Opitutaceae bacterium]
MPQPSLRRLARQLGLSVATISLALRDSPRVVPATKKRVVDAARRAGYRPNPLVRSVMAAMRRSSQESYQGLLAGINYSSDPHPRLRTFHQEVWRGAERRARELGYGMDLCWFGPNNLSLARLSTVLATRNIQGVVVLPIAETHDLSSIDWSGLAGVVMDYCLSRPSLHSVLPDHHVSIFTALERLVALGYRRPGLVLDAARDARLRHKWSGGYYSFFRTPGPAAYLPELLAQPVDRTAFLGWFDRHQPDVIIAHLQTEIIGWLQERGRRVPEDVGFLQLNWTERTGPCAALDLQPGRLGVAAIESLVAQLQRQEHGIPDLPKTITLGAEWIDGPTLRRRG